MVARRSGAWCFAGLLVLSSLQVARAFYLPGVAPQDFAKVLVDVLKAHAIPSGYFVSKEVHVSEHTLKLFKAL